MLDATSEDQKFWLIRLLYNLFGYATILLPGYLILRYVRKRGLYLDDYHTLRGKLVNQLFRGSPLNLDKVKDDAAKGKSERTFGRQATTLLICFLGLQFFYLTWGVLQEKIMTRTYTRIDGFYNEKFTDSQFLVLVNRVLAFFFAFAYVNFTVQPPHRAPLYKYSYCSLSNILSSWCQYEALKFISFPTQVLSKATKIIPVMLMGKIVSRKTYPTYEYGVAVAISFGMVLFLMNSQDDYPPGSTTVTTASGYILLIGYMTFDSFTSNWQSELFAAYKMSPFQMMCGVTFFSCILLSVSLLQTGTLFSSLAFMLSYPRFLWDCTLLSVCSAGGQFFIFFTIAEFGPVVFVIISTVRQILSILLSVIIYGHNIAALGVLGILIVFGSIFVKTYAGYRRQRMATKQTAAAQAPLVSVKSSGSSQAV